MVKAAKIVCTRAQPKQVFLYFGLDTLKKCGLRCTLHGPNLTGISILVHLTPQNLSGLNYVTAWEYVIQVHYAADAYGHLPPMQATVSDSIGHDLYVSWLLFRNVGSEAHRVYEDPRSAFIQYEKLQPWGSNHPDVRETLAYQRYGGMPRRPSIHNNWSTSMGTSILR